jgi:hypothetical protein
MKKPKGYKPPRENPYEAPDVKLFYAAPKNAPAESREPGRLGVRSETVEVDGVSYVREYEPKAQGDLPDKR